MAKGYSAAARTFAGVASVGVLLCASMVVSAFAGIYLTPPEPTEDDSLSIEVRHGFVDGCWYISHHVCRPVSGDSVSIDVYAVDVWQPGWYCPDEVWSYGCTCEYGQLPADHYIVTFTEHHDSLRWPDPRIEVLEFDVLPGTPVETLSWGRIRALYR